MRKLFTCLFLIVLILLFLCSCSSQKTMKPLSELPKKYTVSMAKKNGDTVFVLGNYYNAAQLERFYQNTQKGKDGRVRVTGFTIEGGAIISDLICQNGRIRLTMDTTRDNYGNHGVITYEVKTIQRRQTGKIPEYTAITDKGESIGIL